MGARYQSWLRQHLQLVPYDGRWTAAYAAALVIVIGALVVGLIILDSSLAPIVLAMLAGAAVVGFLLRRRDRRKESFDDPTAQIPSFENGGGAVKLRSRDVWTPESKHPVPFGPYGGGQWTAHPIGLLLVIGLLLMGLVSRTEVSGLLLLSLAGGAIVGLFLWLHHQ